MSSPKAQASKNLASNKVASKSPAAKKPAAKKLATKKPAVKSAASGEPSKADKAAFLKAMMQGIKPGSVAAEKSAAKKKPPAVKKSAPEAPAPKVEVLRRISGAAAVANTPQSAMALDLAKQIEEALANGEIDKLQPHAVQALMAALCKVYSANEDVGNRYPILSGRMAVTGTDVMIVCGALLRAVDLQVFELGMWQSWAGR